MSSLPKPPLATSMMDVRLAISSYFDRIVSSVPGMKTVLLDEHTTRCIAMCYTQSQIMDKGVFLVMPLINKLDPTKNRDAISIDDVTSSSSNQPPPRDKMQHLKCIIICHPSEESIQEILKELASPCYGEYHIFFTNHLKEDVLNKFAQADRYNIVKQIWEYYADYLAVNRDLFDFDLDNYMKLSRNRGRWNATMEYEKLFRRSVKGLLAVLLSLRQKPVIRATAQSELAQMFARELKHEIDYKKDLFDFGSSMSGNTETLLLILDRRDDPVTPLLNQWTYQAMVHELIGIRDNIVDLRSTDYVGHRKPIGSSAAGNTTDDGKKIVEESRFVLSDNQDEFYHSNMYRNWGEVTENTKRMFDSYRAKHNTNMSLKSVEDIQRFVDQFPEFKKLANNATKHISIVQELSKLIDFYQLLDISALEQELACTSDHSNHLEKIRSLIENDKIPFHFKRNIVLLYALRYEAFASNRTAELQRLLAEKARLMGINDPTADIGVVDYMLSYAGMAKRSTQTDLFGPGNDLLRTMFRPMTSTVDNIYTQHKPLLQRILEEAKTGKLPDAKYPKISASGSGIATGAPGAFVPIHKDVIVFMVGGTTYEEAAVVAKFNLEASKVPSGLGFRVLLGGTKIHNSKTFLKELTALGTALTMMT
jgi:vacuolar protein sorting-associated protein 45